MSDPGLVPVGPGRDPATVEDREREEREGSGAFGRAEPGTPPPTDQLGQDDHHEPAATVADVEALLFVAERPLSRAEIGTIARLSLEQVDERLGDLEVQLRERGIRLVASGERVMLGTSPESGRLIARYLGADAVRLSPAALETLAIIAYRQPVTRGVIERIRGVDSGHVVRGLLHRRLIHEQGRAETPGRPILYGTSMEFMERFGLTSLDDLPPLEAEIAARLAQAEADQASQAEGVGEDGERRGEGVGEDGERADTGGERRGEGPGAEEVEPPADA